MISQTFESFLPFSAKQSSALLRRPKLCFAFPRVVLINFIFKMNYRRNISFPSESIQVIKTVLETNHLKLSAVNQIIFLFGAKPNKNNSTAREIFYKYSQKHLKQYQFLQAEDFFKTFTDDSIDLLTIEEQLATYTDCVLILLESPGTIAELGAFALNNDLVKIILAVNKIEHKNEESFISLGPLAKVEKVSSFGKVIYANFKSILKSANAIEERLKNNLRKNSRTIDISTYSKFKDKKNRRFKLLFICDIITLFGPVKKNDLIFILKETYGDNFFNDIGFELGLLKSLGFVNELDGYYSKSVKKEFYFFKYSNINMYKTRFKIINHYAKYQSNRLLISKKINELTD